ncbi:MAG: reverse gyrase, partial [Candidatus Odinarchaeota archaeon]|nr:reverse gyrase [Candidatus Odinarchaeota archaeon]
MSEVVAIYKGLCPNCHGEISDSRLRLKLPCNKCLPIIPSEFDGDLEDYLKIKRTLEENGKLLYYGEFLEPMIRNHNALEFFKKATGRSLWSSQRLWVKRALSGKSFAITAPAGVGKSFFGELMSLYFTIKEKKKCYIIVPTTPLVEQSYRRIKTYLGKVEEQPRVLFYHSELSNSKRREIVEKISVGDFDLLITTSQFLSKNFEKLKDKRFDFIFVDDVDSFFKYSRNIERVLMLLGFDREVIRKAERLLNLKKVLISSKETRNDILLSIRNLRDEIGYWKKEKKVGQIILSSATAKHRGIKVKLFKELLGFDLGVPSEGIRNVYDVYRMVPSGSDLCGYVYEIVDSLGDGGLVFVPKDLGIEEAERISNYLNERGISAAAIHSGNKSLYLPEFIEGRIEVLVGVATQQGVIVRGIDLPWRIRYVVFAEVPRNKLVIESERILPNDVLILMKILSEITEMDEVGRVYRKLKLMYTSLSKEERDKLKESIVKGFSLKGKLEDLRKEFVERGKFCYELIKKPFIQRSLSDYQYARIKVEGSKLTVYFPDVTSYIQASGRTSRIYPGGISTGLSVIISYHKSMINGIRRQLSLRYENLTFKPIDELNVDEIMKRIDEERNFIKKVYEGKIRELKIEDPIKSALLIMESPTKARTIASFFGKPSRVRYGNIELYEVTTGDYILGLIATKGHLFDLVSNEENYGVRLLNESFVPVYGTIKRCSKCGHQFVDSERCPKCGSEEFFDSIEIIKQINNIANDFNVIFIASDPDTEGEKIAWDVKNISFLSKEKKRIELHEITRYALQTGMKNPRDVSMNMVKAQIVRRVEDRWIGYELSKRLRKTFKNERLTAGRVQSAVLYWIIKRYSERMKDLHYFF